MRRFVVLATLLCVSTLLTSKLVAQSNAAQTHHAPAHKASATITPSPKYSASGLTLSQTTESSGYLFDGQKRVGRR